ncbi:UrvD/REP family ATP-dependent DNA helicase [Brachybacterium horti]
MTSTAPALRLLGPDLDALPALHTPATLRAPQREALERFGAGADVLVHGAPRAGRTALALAAAATGDPVLLLAPRRAAAARLRDALAVHGAREARVMTPAALGFALVRSDATRRGLGEPTLVTGADQDALLAELIAQRTDWHLEVDPAARTLPGFRTELRDLVTRATELGLGPDDLEELGRRRGRPAWRDAAALLRDYLGVLDLEAATALDAGPRLDSGGLVRRGARLVAAGAVELPAPRVVVDDAQDLTSAGIALVLALAGAGARVLVTACADEAVDTFRGALPDAAARLAEALGRPFTEVVLDGGGVDGAVPAGPALAVDSLRSRLPLAGAPGALRRPRDLEGSHDGLAVLRARSPLDEARLLASALRDLHHREEIPYDDMAVVCRSGSAVADVADLLARSGLPVRTPRRPRPLREEAVVADLLRIVELGLDELSREPDPLEALELLRGPFGDADQLRLRRIRRLLLAARPEEDETPSEQLLARALVAEEVPGLPAAEARDRAAAPVHRVRAMIAAVRSRAEEGAQEVLWSAWDASALAGGWRRAALGAAEDADGARARLASGRLDALLELFAAAERLADRRPGAGALDLVEQIRGQAVVEDTLAASAAPRGRLAVLTPAQLAGEDRDTIVLARLQEGAWPNLRLRSTLFGAAELSLVGAARPGQEPPPDPDTLHAAQRAQVVADEVRLAVSALSRARTRVLVTAVEDGETSPSALLEALEALGLPAWTDAETLRQDPGPAPDARTLVATLRRRLREADDASGPDLDAAVALRALGEAGAPGADPTAWYHQRPSSEEALQEPGTAVPLSPSALERAHACPRAWLFERAGGSRASGPAQVLGTAVHRLAQEDPRGEAGEEDLLARLHTLLRGVPGLDTWSGRRRVRRAEDAARLLAEHLRTAAAPPLAIEAPFEVELAGEHPVRLRGTVDRIEGDATGLRVVDLKTGAPKTKAAAAEDLQLAAYQTAVQEGAFAEALGEDAGERLGGAELVYLGGGGRRAAVRGQGALTAAEDPEWFARAVALVAEEVSGARVVARRNPHCTHCAVRASCPLQPEGEQL